MHQPQQTMPRCWRWHCGMAPVAGSPWCSRHQYCGELMKLGATIGYPQLDLTPHIFVLRGYEQWLYYAQHFHDQRRQASALMAIIKEHERLAGEENDVHNQ